MYKTCSNDIGQLPRWPRCMARGVSLLGKAHSARTSLKGKWEAVKLSQQRGVWKWWHDLFWWMVAGSGSFWCMSGKLKVEVAVLSRQDDPVAMDFVHCAANLRMQNYRSLASPVIVV